MSWFSEIAGKAEEFLTKVDQTAASALQKPLLQQSPVPSYRNVPAHTGQTVAYRPSVGSILGSPKPKAIAPSPKPKPPSRKDEDEKLLEFLNSSEPAPPQEASAHCDVGAKQSEETIPLVPKEAAAPDKLGDVGGSDRIDAASTAGNWTPGETDRNETVESEVLVKSSDYREETEMLQKEVTSLNQEIAAVLQRAKAAELEKKHLQDRLDHLNGQESSSDSAIRELQARERDLSAALEAKDSQLAVLRVRLQEADQELNTKRQLLDQLRAENQRLSKEENDACQVQGKMVDTLREKLAEAEESLRKERENHRTAQAEAMQRQMKLEEELRSLSDSLSLAQRQLSEQKAQNRDLSSQLTSSRCSAELARQELADYKQKAQRILQSKEKLISSLKEAANSSGTAPDADESHSTAEQEAAVQECELLREELRRAQARAEAAVVDLQEQEASYRRETESLQEQQRTLLEELRAERRQRQEAELETRQNADELTFLKEELRRTKDSLQQRLVERDAEVDKLRKQVATKSMSTTSEAELEARLHALTESLIQKQTLVEALSTEKNSLVLQLERLEGQLKEVHAHNSRSHTAIGGFAQPEENVIRSRVSGMFTESPFDGSVARKVKRAYGVVDSFSVRVGTFLRRYPLARIFILIYMGLLHFWVMIVLLTYEPEIHGLPYNKTRY